MQNISALKEVIHENLEPGVITNDMIVEAFRSEIKGEYGRLRDMDPVNYDDITLLRLDFKNILRIDHLWVLPNLTKLSLNFNKLEKVENIEMLINLKELDLSFNFIESIGEVMKLINLEVLSLANNLINKIENFDKLSKLMILSLANNQIESTQGLERFRFLNNLKVLNLEGNPISKDPNFRIYIAAVLPDLKYYNYIYIRDEEREAGMQEYERLIRDISNSLEEEFQNRKQAELDAIRKSRYGKTFVEPLADNQLHELIRRKVPLFDSLHKLSEEIDILMKIFKYDFEKITNNIFRYGVQQFVTRKSEIGFFEKGFQTCERYIQKAGRLLVDSLNESRDDKLAKTRVLYLEIEKQRMLGMDYEADETDPSDLIDFHTNELNLYIDELWEILLRNEVHLNEATLEIFKRLEKNLKVMVDEFLFRITDDFEHLNNIVKEFMDKLTILLTNYDINNEFLQKQPKLLHQMSTEAHILKFVSIINETHTELIKRAKKLVETSITKWRDDYLKNRRQEEMLRNRAKMVEINYYLDQTREVFQKQYTQIQEEMLENDDIIA